MDLSNSYFSSCKISIIVFLTLGIFGHIDAADQKGDELKYPYAHVVADQLLADLVDISGVPGMGAAVTQNGELLWAGSAGVHDREASLPVSKQTVFRLASVSKLLTASAAAKLAEEGKLDLDAPLGALLPYLKPHMAAITARQLAAHVSGLPHYQAIDAARGGTHYATTEQAVEVFKKRKLLFPPGSEYSYSSYGYTLLGAAIEAAANMPFLDFIDKEIVRDLEIQPDGVLLGHENASRVYTVENGRVEPAPMHDYSYSWGGAGYSATAPALAVFGARFIAGEIIKNETMNMVRTPSRLNNGEVVKESDFIVGLGWRLSTASNGTDYIHHSGVAIGARSALVAIPDSQISAVILSNASWVSAIEKTAVTLAELFKDGATAVPSCPLFSTSYEGTFDSQIIEGSLTFSNKRGLCMAVVKVENEFGQWLTGFTQGGSPEIKMVFMRTAGGQNKAVLATHVGLFVAEVSSTGLVFATIGRQRNLEFTINNHSFN